MGLLITVLGPFLALRMDLDHWKLVDNGRPRLAGEIAYEDGESILIAYERDLSWRMVKQLLMDTAVPMPNYDPHQVGSGLVSRPNIRNIFGEFGLIEVDPEEIPTVDVVTPRSR